MPWSLENINTTLFIREVQKRRELWDNKVPGYSCNKKGKQKLWDSVGEAMLTDFNEKSVPEKNDIRRQLQRRWKSLRDSFTREVGRMKRLEPGRTSFADCKPSYVYFKKLVFLLDVVDCGNDNGVAVQNGGVDPSGAARLETGAWPEAVSGRAAPPRCKSSKGQQAKLKRAAEALPVRKVEYDGDRLFVLSLIKELRKVPEECRLDVKLELMKVLRRGQRRSAMSYFPPEVLYANESAVAANVTVNGGRGGSSSSNDDSSLLSTSSFATINSAIANSFLASKPFILEQ